MPTALPVLQTVVITHIIWSAGPPVVVYLALRGLAKDEASAAYSSSSLVGLYALRRHVAAVLTQPDSVIMRYCAGSLIVVLASQTKAALQAYFLSMSIYTLPLLWLSGLLQTRHLYYDAIGTRISLLAISYICYKLVRSALKVLT